MRSIARARSITLSRASLRGVAALVVAIALLAAAATAIAAHPKKGARFAGSIAGTGINGFKPPVTFTVSSSATTLTRFTFSTLGCFGSGGFRPGVDYYTQPSALIKVGTVKVSKSGHFSLAGAVVSYSGFGVTTTTTTSVSGSFTTPRTAIGTVSFTQKLSGKDTGSCGPAKLQFTAKG
jgi:hypothetical protein